MAHHDHDAPPPDDTPPRHGLIAFYAGLAVITLGGLHFVFTSYFKWTAEGLVYSEQLSRPSSELGELRADEAARFAAGEMDIDRAMQQLARGGRVSPRIAPSPSDDLGALAGWGQDPHPEREAVARRAMSGIDGGLGVVEGVDAGIIDLIQLVDPNAPTTADTVQHGETPTDPSPGAAPPPVVQPAAVQDASAAAQHAEDAGAGHAQQVGDAAARRDAAPRDGGARDASRRRDAEPAATTMTSMTNEEDDDQVWEQ